MGIVSYAQNFEDVMLWRALQSVKNGFYIDIGANHPIVDSVTKAFYDKGWHGINIEPELELFELLEKDRPLDINLNIAISSDVKSIDFYVSKIRGWSTTDKNSSTNLDDKNAMLEVRTVEAKSLDEICQKYTPKEIHFLKIDVEGAEKDVLESFSFDIYRPWICVVEATKPTTQIDISHEWEYILKENKYTFVYFDGLNKYYIAKEKEKELKQFFMYPPNIFDDFTLISTVESNNKAHEWWIKANQVEAKANDMEAKANDMEAKANEAVHNYHIIMNSNSWKMTKPLRIIGKGSRWFSTGVKHWVTLSPTSRPRRVMKKTLLYSKEYVNAHPKLKQKAINTLNHFPKLKKRLRRVENSAYHPQALNLQTDMSNTPMTLSPRAKEIYNDLKQAIEQQGNK